MKSNSRGWRLRGRARIHRPNPAAGDRAPFHDRGVWHQPSDLVTPCPAREGRTRRLITGESCSFGRTVCAGWTSLHKWRDLGRTTGSSLGLAGSVKPAYASGSLHATNYAVGAARAYDDGKNVNLSDQVQKFLEDCGGAAPSDALYVIEMGGNDIRDAIVAYQAGGQLAAAAVMQEAIASIAHNIQLLYAAGARDFLVWLPPNPGLTPAIRTLNQINPGVTQLATGLTQSFNAGLSGVLTQLSGLPGITIRRLDAFALLNGIVGEPSGYDLTNTATPCLTPDAAPFFCQQPDEYLFWDGIHPTKAAHAIVAATASLLIGQ